MAKITLTIQDAFLPRVVSSICTNFGYKAILVDMIGNKTQNPETPDQFSKRMLIEQVKGWMRTVEGNAAVAPLITQINSDIDNVGIS